MMRRLFFSSVAIGFCFFLFQSSVAYFLPLDHPAYEALDYLAGNNLLPMLSGNAKPYQVESVLTALQTMDTLRLNAVQKTYLDEAEAFLKPFHNTERDNKLLLEMYLKGESDLSGGNETYRLRLCGGAAYSLGRFTLADRVCADLTDQKNRFDYLERQFKANLPSDMPQAYLAYCGDRFGLLLGRNAFEWGPAKFGHLFLGSHQPSLNAFSGWAHIGFLDGYTLSAKLNSLQGYNRYLSASRVVLKITSSLNLALNQSVVYSGEKRGFEAYYLLPSYIYYFSQFGFTDSNSTENTFVGADAEWRVPGKYHLYFEFLADDFQVDRDSVSSNTQNSTAWTLGAELFHLGPGMDFGAEFTHINSYVYKHMGGLPTHYISNTQGGVIGHPLGPDAEVLYLWTDYRIKRYIQTRLLYSLERKGDLNDILGAWNAWNKASESVPHGIIENTQTLSLELCLKGWKGLNVAADIGYQWIRNPAHQAGKERSARFGVQAAYYFGYLLSWNTRPTLFPVKSDE